jgi:UDP-3-O-acyl-N-acetylglucosamine deacetylase
MESATSSSQGKCGGGNRYTAIDLTGYSRAMNNPNLNLEKDTPVIHAACRNVGSLIIVSRSVLVIYMAIAGGKRNAKMAQCLHLLYPVQQDVYSGPCPVI